MEFNDINGNKVEESDASSSSGASDTSRNMVEDPYGLLSSSHIAAAAEDAAAVSRREKGRKRKYRTEDERLEANRKLAAASRQRKKMYVQRLMKEVQKLQRENEDLRTENATLRRDTNHNPSPTCASTFPPLHPQQVQGNSYSQQSLLTPSARAQAISNLVDNNDIHCVPDRVGDTKQQQLAEMLMSSGAASASAGQITPEMIFHLQNSRRKSGIHDQLNLRKQLLDDMTAQYLSLNRFGR